MRKGRNTVEYATRTENTKRSAQVQISGKLGVYLVFERAKRKKTSLHEVQFAMPRYRIKWAFLNDMIR